MIPIKKTIYIFVTRIDQVEQQGKEKLDRSASNKLDRPTSEMPKEKHQPSALSTEIFVCNFMLFVFFWLAALRRPSVPSRTFGRGAS